MFVLTRAHTQRPRCPYVLAVALVWLGRQTMVGYIYSGYLSNGWIYNHRLRNSIVSKTRGYNYFPAGHVLAVIKRCLEISDGRLNLTYTKQTLSIATSPQINRSGHENNVSSLTALQQGANKTSISSQNLPTP